MSLPPGSTPRAERRQRALKGATIVFNNGRSTISCLVRDLSVGGARLKVASTQHIPEAFELRLTDERGVHQCRVAWRSFEALGVTFRARERSQSHPRPA